MFNEKINQKIEELNRKIEELHKKQFRVGDKVYINDVERSSPIGPVYLRVSYNNGSCYYTSEESDGEVLEYAQFGFHVSEMSHTPPEKCPCCGKVL